MSIRRLADSIVGRSPLPEGTLAVGTGLIVAGLTGYGFLVISARMLGAEGFDELSALWALMFLAGPGFFLPLEQEVSRAVSARRSRGLGGAPAIRRVAQVGLGFVIVLLLATAISAEALTGKLFDGQKLLLVGFAAALIGFATQHLAKGSFSGNGRFHRYGLLIGSEGVLRLGACGLIAVLSIRTSGPYGLILGLAPLASTAVAFKGGRDLALPGPPAGLREVSEALGYLLAASLLGQVLINSGPLAIKLLANESEPAAAGRFLAGLVVARIPIFLFQAVQAALLPLLSGHAAAGRHTDFNKGFKRLLGAVAVVGALATLGATVGGPWAVRLLFGSDFVLTRMDLGLLSAASAFFLLATALSQALIALSGHSRVALGWLAALVAFGITTWVVPGLMLRVELGFLAGAVSSAGAMGLLLIPSLASAASHSAEELLKAPHQVPLEP